MANDIAKLGIEADTKGLQKAKADLNAIVPPAEKAERAAKKAGDAITQMGNKADAAAAGLRDIKGAADQAAAGTSHVDTATTKASGGVTRLTGWLRRLVESFKTVRTETDATVTRLSRLGTAANDNLNAVQATPANIAAQFQDIGVTAAAGMNPLLIALQQGTQLSVAFSQGFSGIGEALKQIFSPVALLTIGAVALVAALIQMVDWASVGKTVLNGLADVMETAAPYAVGLAAGLALINAPAILTGVVALTKGMWGLAAGMLAAVGIPTLLVAGLVAIVAAANYFRDDLTKILGFDIVAAAKLGVNIIVGFFVGAYNSIVKSWGMIGPAIDDILAQAVQYTRNRVEQMINSAIDGINSLLSGLPDWLKMGTSGQIARVKFEGIPNPNAGAAKKLGNVVSGEMAAADGRKVDYVGKGVAAIESGAKYLAGKLRGFADGIGKEKDKAGKKTKDAADNASKGKTDAEKFSDIVADADRRIAALEAESKMIGVYGEALYTAKAKLDMLTDASRKGLTLDKEQLSIIDQKAKKIGELTAQNEKLVFLEDMRVNATNRIADLKAEQAALGLYGQDLRQVQLEYQLLNDAKKKNIDLTPAEIAGIKQLAAEQAGLEEAIKRQREKMEWNRSTVRGFFTDFVQGARDGQGAWGAFSNAFNNFMDRMIDKLLNEVLDAVFQVNKAVGSTGSGGGLLGGIGKLFGGIFGGGGFGSAASITNATSANIAGNSFGMAKFAKGDAFTNSIVSRPTAFAFGKGGANLGIMGEDDPEAVMPLKRGPDGSLGVQMYGGGGNRSGGSAPAQEVYVKVSTDDERFNAYVDGRVMAQTPAIAQVGSALSQREASFKQSRRLG